MKSKKIHPQFALLIIFFAIPVIVSYFLYYYHDYFTLKKMHHGVLIKPVISMPFLMDKNEKKWKIIYVANGKCDTATACEYINYQLHQVKTALGKESKRVAVVTIDYKNFPSSLSPQNKIYLLDPLGNLFMYYSNKTNPLDIHKDLKRVLEVSQIG